jgi:hypothetical protein
VRYAKSNILEHHFAAYSRLGDDGWASVPWVRIAQGAGIGHEEVSSIYTSSIDPLGASTYAQT